MKDVYSSDIEEQDNWRYKDTPIYEVPDNIVSFVYIIRDIGDGYYYIGKKSFYHKRYYVRGGKKIYQYVESDWLDYFGSSDSFLEYVDIVGRGSFERKILHLCSDNSVCNYLEIYEQIRRNVLYDNKSFNGNIAGRYYFNKKVCKHLSS
jgi:hypothetical protein